MVGKACGDKLSQDGASVVINYYSDEAGANALASSIDAKRAALSVHADAGSMDGITRLVDETVRKFDHIDVMMANAAMMMMRNVENTTGKDVDAMFNLDIKVPYFLAQPSLDRLVDYLFYASSKGASKQMTRIMPKGLASRGITVNEVGIGPTASELSFKGRSSIIDRLADSVNQPKVPTWLPFSLDR